MPKTRFYNKVEREWVLVDAKDKVLGRLAVQIARILMGKNKSTYTPNSISGDAVVVINARYISVSGNKRTAKIYNKYTGYPSGRKEITLEELMQKNPTKAVYKAVRGMLPKNILARKMIRMLKVYPEKEHPHVGQSPKTIEV